MHGAHPPPPIFEIITISLKIVMYYQTDLTLTMRTGFGKKKHCTQTRRPCVIAKASLASEPARYILNNIS